MVPFILVLILLALCLPRVVAAPAMTFIDVALCVVGLLCLLQVMGGVTLLPALR